MSLDQPSPRLVLQRVRNRIIEYLELVSSFEAQRQYQVAVPGVSVPSEIINEWEDWVRDDWRRWFVSPVFSAAELDAVAAYYAVWNHVAAETPNPLPGLDQLVDSAEWEQLRVAAEHSLRVFRQRGKMSEDWEDP